MAKKKRTEFEEIRKTANSTRHGNVAGVYSAFGLDGKGRIEQARDKSKRANPALNKKKK